MIHNVRTGDRELVDGKKLLLCLVACVLAISLLAGLTRQQLLNVTTQYASIARMLVPARWLPPGAWTTIERPFVTTAVPKPAGKTVSLGASLAGYQEFQFTDKQGRAMNFLMYVPPSSAPGRKFPLVLVLEGSGEESQPGMSPSQGLSLLAGHPYVTPWVPDPANPGAPNVQSRWPSFIVIPQLTSPNRWVDVSGNQGSYQLAASPTVGLEMAKELMDTLQSEYSQVDGNRLYVTGISMGAYGTWEMVERWPGYFAAAVPVAGGGDPSKAYLLKDLPIWVFQGAADTLVPVSATQDMVSAIEAAGGNPKYTLLPGLWHDDTTWTAVYDVTAPSATNLFQWLFAQHKSGA